MQVIVPQVQALSAAQKNAFSSGVYYFNTEDSDPGLCTVGSDVKLTGGDRGAQAFNYLVQNGFTPAQAAGIIGNMDYESGGVDPLKYQGDEKDHQVPPGPDLGWGIVQFTPNTKIINYAASVNKPAYELQTQLEFVVKQLNGTAPFSNEKNAGDEVRSTTTVEAATRAFYGDRKFGGIYTGYERPAETDKSLPTRVAKAKIALSTYGAGISSANTTAATAPGASTDPCGGAVSGNLAQTILNYTLPDYHQAPYLEAKPSYKAAIAKAQANGEYVGGGPNPGIDCGGFITRVMRDSGADPNYNWGPKDSRQGNTSAQKAYMDAHPEKYENLGPKTSTDGLQLGDIAINGSHTYMFVKSLPGFNGNSASASFSTTGQSWRAPMASPAYWSGEGEPFIWYRLKS